MLQVSEVLDLPTDVDVPEIQASRRLPAAVGADEHVECRSLAEQLVCEANVVLTANACGRISLDDDLAPGVLSFSLSYAGREARIVTTIGHDVAIGHLYGIGAQHLGNVELSGADQVERLILLLIGGDQDTRGREAVPEPGTLVL